VQTARARVQHVAGVAEARDALAVQQVRVDARDLRRDVGAQAQRAARQLIDQLEGAQPQVGAAAVSSDSRYSSSGGITIS
jgi:hypothetical protein